MGFAALDKKDLKSTVLLSPSENTKATEYSFRYVAEVSFIT